MVAGVSNFVLGISVLFTPRTYKLSQQPLSRCYPPNVQTGSKGGWGTVQSGWLGFMLQEWLGQCVQYLISTCERCCRPQKPSKFRQEWFIMDRNKSCSVAQGGGVTPSRFAPVKSPSSISYYELQLCRCCTLQQPKWAGAPCAVMRHCSQADKSEDTGKYQVGDLGVSINGVKERTYIVSWDLEWNAFRMVP